MEVVSSATSPLHPPPGGSTFHCPWSRCGAEPTAGLDILDHGQIFASAKNRTTVPRSSRLQHTHCNDYTGKCTWRVGGVTVSLRQTMTSSVHLWGFRGSFYRTVTAESTLRPIPSASLHTKQTQSLDIMRLSFHVM
jgi:hypothetical protein